MEAGSADEFIERIQRIPLNKFDPGKEGSYRDQMNIAFTGYSINRTSLIGQINSYSKELSNNIEGLDKQISNHKNEYDRLATKKDLTDAESKKLDQYTKEVEKLDNFTQQQDNVNQVNNMIETGASTEQITAAINRNNIGVQQIQKNQLFEATSESMGRLKATTGGFDLRDKKSWSPEMIAIGKAYNQRVQEAKEAGYKDKHRTTDVEDLGGIKLQESYKDASGKKLTIDELKRQGISKGRIRGLKAIEATDDEIVPALELKLKIKYIAYDGETYTLEQLKADGFSETMIRLAVVRGTLK
jgi:hypothetical protein